MSRLQPIGFVLAAALLAGVLIDAQGTPPGAPLIMLTREGRRPVPTTIQSGLEFIALDDVSALFQVAVREDTLAGGVTITFKGRTVVASPEQPMASVNGRLVALPSPAIRGSGGRWLVPVEFLSRALGPIYEARIELRRASRLLIVGDLQVPRVTARIEAQGPPTRMVLDISPAAEVTTTEDPARVLVQVAADALDVRLPIPGGGLIDGVRAGDTPTSLVVALRNAARVSATTSTSGTTTRVTVEAHAAGSTTEAPPPPAPEPAAPPVTTPRAALSTIVLDPGHGGEDAGVTAGNVVEKNVTLEVARRVKALIEARLGIRVLLTREDDRSVGLDERAALANNNKADLFISFHANGSFVGGLSGAEVFFLSLDAEMEAARREARAEAVVLPVLGGGTRSIEVIRWDMAQARHIESSEVLAGILENELRSRVPLAARSLQRAPLRVLVGVNMPAVLVEMAYLTNAAQAGRAASPEFQTAIAQAVYETVLRFREQLEKKR